MMLVLYGPCMLYEWNGCPLFPSSFECVHIFRGTSLDFLLVRSSCAHKHAMQITVTSHCPVLSFCLFRSFVWCASRSLLNCRCLPNVNNLNFPGPSVCVCVHWHSCSPSIFIWPKPHYRCVSSLFAILLNKLCVRHLPRKICARTHPQRMIKYSGRVLQQPNIEQVPNKICAHVVLSVHHN